MNPVFELLTKIAEVFTGPQKSRLDAIAKPVEQYDPTPPRPVDWNEAEKNIRPEDADTTKRTGHRKQCRDEAGDAVE